MYNSYQWINKIDRRKNGEVWFQKGYHLYTLKGLTVLSTIDEFKINNPSYLQKYRFCVIEDSNIILLDHDNQDEIYNRYIYTDLMGRMAFCKDIKLLSYF